MPGQNIYIEEKRSKRIIKKLSKLILGEPADKLNRSTSGNVLMFIFVGIFAAFSAIPLVLSIGMALKPINELFLYPPTLLPRRPTLNNFVMLFDLMSTTWVPFSRYIFNTVFITLAATVGHVLIASMAAFPLAKHVFPGKNLLNAMILLSLMFVPAVADVANYITMAGLGWIDSYFAVIVPFIGTSLGIFLMRNYMTTIPDSLLDSSKIDGSGDLRTFWTIIMPIVKPAWLTLTIIMFQTVWGQPHTLYIYREEMKTLPYALSQIIAGGIIRAGAGQAVGVMMMLVPATVFVINQAKILETMATSGIKE